MNTTNIVVLVVEFLVCFIALGGLVWFYNNNVQPLRKELLQKTNDLVKERDDAQKELEARRKEAMVAAKDEAYRLRAEMDRDNRDKRAEIGRLERRLAQKEEALESAAAS